MSNFDLKLDRWNKIATILIGVLGLFISGYVALFILYPAFNKDNAKRCFDTENETLDRLKNNPKAQSDSYVVPVSYIDSIIDICDTSHEEAEIRIKRLLTFIRSGAKIDDATLKGYVSLGLKVDYQTSNFRNLKTDEKALKYVNDLKKGTVLKARWSVNLRTNKKHTDSGDNPSIAIIYDNECVKMEEDLPKDALRGSYWVKVSLSECKVPD